MFPPYFAFGLCLSCLPFILSLYFYYGNKKQWSLFFLFAGALIIRLIMITANPFLNPWDERFHALVAKNMIVHPFIPMLRVDPILPYDYMDWSCNHIWLHKQPLFMWQMALSMKLFGVNIIGLRLPGAIMGAIIVLMIFRITLLWTKDHSIAYVAAFLFAVSRYHLELVSGQIGLDQNDLTFCFYILASIWAWCEYERDRSAKWLILIGLFSGAAILNKWLTGLLVYAGWALVILSDKNERGKISNYLQMLAALIVTVIVFLPWQLYIHFKFPLESTREYQFNLFHITKVLDGRTGSIFYHLSEMQNHYGLVLLVFLFIGLVLIIKLTAFDRKITVSLLFMYLFVYAFFSIIVKTKMPSFCFIVAPIGYILGAIGLVYALRFFKKLNLFTGRNLWLPGLILMIVALDAFKPWEIIDRRMNPDAGRQSKLHNTLIFQHLNRVVSENTVVINCSYYEDIELMFWQNVKAYNNCPSKEELSELLNKGYPIAAFKNHAEYILPDYVLSNKRIKIIDEQLQ